MFLFLKNLTFLNEEVLPPFWSITAIKFRCGTITSSDQPQNRFKTKIITFYQEENLIFFGVFEPRIGILLFKNVLRNIRI